MKLLKQAIGQLLLAASFVSATREDIDSPRLAASFDSATKEDIDTPRDLQELTTCRPGEILFELELVTDRFPQDTSYVVTDIPAGRVVISADSFDDKQTYLETRCLACSTYKFEIFDDYGDGLYNAGGFSLKIDGSTVLSQWNRQGETNKFDSLAVTFAGSGGDCTLSPAANPTISPTASKPPTVAPTPLPTRPPTPYPTASAPPTTQADNCRDTELTVVVDILTDEYPQDTTIDVFNVTNATAKTTFYTAPQPLAGEALNTFAFCAPCKDKYELYIKDSYGDGIYKPGNYNITVDGKNKGGGKVENRGVTTPFSGTCKDVAPTLSPAPSDSPTTSSFGECVDDGDINFLLELKTDKWAEETSLTVVDTLSGVTVLKVKSFEKDTLVKIQECLPCSDYTLTVFDSEDDGIEGDGLKLYVDKELVKSTKVEGSETSVDFMKKCPRDNDVYIRFSQDFKSPVELNPTSTEAFEDAMETFAKKMTEQYDDTECMLKCIVLSDEFDKVSKSLDVEYALTCKTSGIEPDLYRLRWIELAEEKKSELEDLLTSAGITALKVPKYIDDKPPPTMSPTESPSAMPTIKSSFGPTGSPSSAPSVPPTTAFSSAPSSSPSMEPSAMPSTAPAALLFYQEFMAADALSAAEMTDFESIMTDIARELATFVGDTGCGNSFTTTIEKQVYTGTHLIIDYVLDCANPPNRQYAEWFPQRFGILANDLTYDFDAIGLTIEGNPVLIVE